MSYSNNKTFELWRKFMSRQNEITNRLNTNYYSIQVYDQLFDFTAFTPDTEFEKWAAVEVLETSFVPEGMESYILPAGPYAVFLHKGTSATFYETWKFIFQNWLPGSQYQLDNLPHFELLGDKYKREDPASEEEVWIPVTNKY